MSDIPRTSRRALLFFGPMLLLTARYGAAAEPSPVKLAEVTSQVPGSAIKLGDAVGLLKKSAEAELSAIPWSKTDVRGRYLLSLTLVKLESLRSSDAELKTSCAVSAAVRDDRGAILAVVNGRSSALGPARYVAENERDALWAAVRSAVAGVPEAIKRGR